MDSELSNNGTGSSGGNVSVGSRSRVVLAPKWLGKRVGRFKLLALLGQGAMGRVFRAEDTLMQRHVALKLLPRTVKRGGNNIGGEMLIREARAAASIEHPGAVQIYEINEAGDVYYIAMELLEGGSLRDLVKAAGPLDVTRACLLAAEAAETLSYAHTIGVVHRDVKPANLMLNRAGRCKVVDFGLARVDDPSDLTSFLAESVGTPQFIAPEILTGTPASAQSDMYSLGGTVWYLLTGHPPFEAGTSQELLQKHVSCPLPDLRAIRPDVPQGLADALARSLAKRPGERYPSMDQFAKVLRVHTIPLAASAADMEAMAASGIIPSPAPQAPPTPVMSEATAAPVYVVPPSPVRATGSVSRPASPLDERPASPLDSRPASPVTRPASPVNRPARPATPFDEAPVEETPVEEQVEAAVEEEAPAALGYAAPMAGIGKSLKMPIVIGSAAVITVIGIIIACVILLKPPTAPVSDATSQGPSTTQHPSAKMGISTTPPAQQAVFSAVLVAQWSADDYKAGTNWIDRQHGIVAEKKGSPTVVANTFDRHAGVTLNGKNQFFLVHAADVQIGDGKAFMIAAVFRAAGNGHKGKDFWNSSGLVGADVKGTVDDWALGWGGGSGTQIVAGAGNFPPGSDATIQSAGVDIHHTHSAIMTWQVSGSQSTGTGELTLYVDGAEVAHEEKPTAPRMTNIPIALGAMSANGAMSFNGKLAEIRIYNGIEQNPAALSEQLLSTYMTISHDAGAVSSDPNGLLKR